MHFRAPIPSILYGTRRVGFPRAASSIFALLRVRVVPFLRSMCERVANLKFLTNFLSRRAVSSELRVGGRSLGSWFLGFPEFRPIANKARPCVARQIRSRTCSRSFLESIVRTLDRSPKPCWMEVVHDCRLPVIKRNHAKFPIPEALNQVFLGVNSIQKAPEF